MTEPLTDQRFNEIQAMEPAAHTPQEIGTAIECLSREIHRLRRVDQARLNRIRDLQRERDVIDDCTAGANRQIARLRAELEQARAPMYDNATRALDYLAALDTSHMSTDAIGLGLDIVAMLDGPGDPTATPTPACSCAAEPVHQAGCDAT